MEACDSGSMWTDLSNDLNIYVVTSANAKESSWGTYCAKHNTVNGIDFYHTCLGDLFSVSWMEDSDETDIT